MTARIAYISVFLAAAAFIVPLGRPVSFVELAIMYVLGALCYEFSLFKLRKKIIVWPSDRNNAERIVGLMGRGFIDDVRSAEFGWISDVRVDQLRSLAHPELGNERFHDSDLMSCYRYLREEISDFLMIVDSEMFPDDYGRGRQVIPYEWKAAPHDSELHQRYREAQRKLSRAGLGIERAVVSFANCFQGASYRL